MSFTTFTNVITILFCLAVLVQSMRLMSSLKQVREGQLDRTVAALDTATVQARGVLSALRETLSTDGAASARALRQAREIREELNVLVGIANAMAERLVDAAASQPAKPAVAPPQPKKTGPARTPRAAKSAPVRKVRARQDAAAKEVA